MKKTLLGIAAMTGLLFATSCSNEQFSNPVGKPGTIQFNVGIEQSLGTRAISDGTNATDLAWQIFDQEGNVLIQSGTGTLTDLSDNFQVQLPAGNYQAVFWAQSPDAPYSLSDNGVVTIDYTGIENNDENLDAFYALLPLEVNGDGTESVSLKRPFAQINVGFTEEANIDASESSVTIEGQINNQINLLTGAVVGTQGSQEFTTNAVPKGMLSVSINGEEQTFEYVSMTYFLVNEKANIDLTLDLGNGKTYPFENVPVQRNFRTNILGGVEQGTISFTVTIDPQYNEPANNVYPQDITVSDVTVNLSEEGVLTLSANYEPKDATIDNAYFLLTPAAETMTLLSRAEEGVVKVEATAEDGVLSATVEDYTTLELNPNSTYGVSVEINGQEIIAENDGEPTTPPTFETPEEEPTAEYPEHLYIVGNIYGSDWASSSPLELTSNTPGIYVIESVTLSDTESYFAFITQPLSNDDWDTLNANRYGPAEKDTPLNTTSPNAIVKIGDTAWKTEGGTYKMTVDLTTMELTVNFLENLPTPESSSIWVVGNGSNMTWDLPGQEITGENNVFTFTITNGSEFKFSTVRATKWNDSDEGDGPAFNSNSYATGNTTFGDQVYQQGQTLKIQNWGENQSLPWTGDYTITINLNEMTMTALTNTVKPDFTVLYIRGDMNGWGTNMELSTTDGENYSYTGFTCTTAQGFKIADAGYSAAYNFGTSTKIAPNTPVVMTASSTSPNSYVSVNVTNATVKFTLSSKTIEIVTE